MIIGVMYRFGGICMKVILSPYRSNATVLAFYLLQDPLENIYFCPNFNENLIEYIVIKVF